MHILFFTIMTITLFLAGMPTPSLGTVFFSGSSISGPVSDKPQADAGDDQTVNEHEAEQVTLDGTQSTADPHVGIGSYEWEQIYPSQGPFVVELINENAAQAAFDMPNVIDEVSMSFQLTVVDNDGEQDTDACVVTITGGNDPPMANAGDDLTVYEGETVTLDGAGSADPDTGDGIVTYQWEQIEPMEGPFRVQLENANAAQPTFIPPDVGRDGVSLSFQLTVTDGGGLQDTDTCKVNVLWKNEPPIADAGEDQRVDEGVTVTLDGSGSFDPDEPDDSIFSYQWEQINLDGDEAEDQEKNPYVMELTDAGKAQASFKAPSVGVAGKALFFKLTVTDGEGLQGTDTCNVYVSSVIEDPTAYAGCTRTVYEGETVTLDGSGSVDPDGYVVSAQWKQTDDTGYEAALSDPKSIRPTFVAPSLGDGKEPVILVFKLTITDNQAFQGTDEVKVKVCDNGITGFPPQAIPILTAAGETIGIECGEGTHLTRLNGGINPSSFPDKGKPEDLIYGLIDTELKVDTAGDTARITFHLQKDGQPSPAPDGYKWYKYNSKIGWVSFDRGKISGGTGEGAEFNKDRTRVTLYITDDTRFDDKDYDDDPRPGIIRDPGGLGYIAPPPPPDDGEGSGCFIDSAVSKARN